MKHLFIIAFDWFQKKCRAVASSRLQIRTLHAGLNISINVAGIYLKSSEWHIADVDLKFTNCQLKASYLSVERERSSSDVQLHIRGSQIESTLKIKDSIAILENCTTVSTQVAKEEIMVQAINSTITLKSLHVEMFQGGGFLQVTTGHVHIVDSTFAKCASKYPLINIFQHSVLSVDNCTFAWNDVSEEHVHWSGEQLHL